MASLGSNLAERIELVEKRCRGIEAELRKVRRLSERPPTLRAHLAEASHGIELLAEDSSGPILAGPWLGEVGYELLYWIPFLNWAIDRHPDLANRMCFVSRGGAGSWYRHLSPRYADAFDFVDLEEFSARRGHRQKQVEMTTFEQEILVRAQGALGLDAFTVLHPSLMYVSMLALAREGAVARFREISLHRQLSAPRTRSALAEELPDDYVAVRFYFNNSFPDHERNRLFVRSVIAALASEGPIVVLNPGLRVDDHSDFEATDSERIIAIDRFVTPATNLEVQTAVISRARAFVGTYGGLSYLPAFYGVPTVAFYSGADQFIRRHLDLAQAVFGELGLGPYLALHTEEIALLDLIKGAVADVLDAEAAVDCA